MKFLNNLVFAMDALNCANDGVTIVDMTSAEQPLVFINKAFENMTGYTCAEVVGKNCRFLQGDLVQPSEILLIHQALKKQESCRVILKNIKKDGRLFWNELSLAPIKNAKGKVTHYVGIQKDVTDEIIQKQKMALLLQQDNLEAKGGIIMALAHEINQPLATIATYSKACLLMVEQGEQEKNKLIQPLKKIEAQALITGEIIHTINNNFNQTHSHNEKIDINFLLKEMIIFLSLETYNPDLKIIWNLDDKLPKIEGDKVQIMHVILNLVRNSLEAFQRDTESNPTLTIDTDLLSDAISIQICDNGPGMPEEFKDPKLGTFFTSKKVGIGTGLGICAKLINLHGGTFKSTINKEKGACFRFTLPIKGNVSS